MFGGNRKDETIQLGIASNRMCLRQSLAAPQIQSSWQRKCSVKGSICSSLFQPRWERLVIVVAKIRERTGILLAKMWVCLEIA